MTFMNRKPDTIFRHYKCSGEVEEITQAEASGRMEALATDWETKNTPQGKLYRPVYDWEHEKEPTGKNLNIPRLREGGTAPTNENASAYFDTPLYGDCFLETTQIASEQRAS